MAGAEENEVVNVMFVILGDGICEPDIMRLTVFVYRPPSGVIQYRAV